MRNFDLIAQNIDILPLHHEVMRQPELWNQHRFRTTYTGTPHVDVDDIWLRYSAPEHVADPTKVEGVVNDDRAVWYEAASKLPSAKPLVLSLMQRVGAHQLDRLLITRVRPGGRILRHADAAGGYVNRDNIARYHVVLNGLPGSIYKCGDETVNMRTGEVWWFAYDQEHEVVNNSEADRMHLLVDLRLWP